MDFQKIQSHQTVIKSKKEKEKDNCQGVTLFWRQTLIYLEFQVPFDLYYQKKPKLNFHFGHLPPPGPSNFCAFMYSFSFLFLLKAFLKIILFRDVQVPVQPPHPSQRATAREEQGEVDQAEQEGKQGVNKRRKITRIENF